MWLTHGCTSLLYWSFSRKKIQVPIVLNQKTCCTLHWYIIWVSKVASWSENMGGWIWQFLFIAGGWCATLKQANSKPLLLWVTWVSQWQTKLFFTPGLTSTFLSHQMDISSGLSILFNGMFFLFVLFIYLFCSDSCFPLPFNAEGKKDTLNELF